MQIQDYQTNELIYESVNSSVYRAVRKLDGLPVILKVLKEDYPSPIELIRYKQEYELVRHLKVAGVIKAFGLEKSQNTLVIILEDFGGDSLRNLLNCYQFTLNEFLTIAIKIADSLGQIHAKNIIHKDINPANIIYRPQTGQLKIIDFGISTQLSRQHFTLKTPSTLEGTLAYISPEQTGRMNRSLDYRSDFYSLGVTLYELLTKQLPFTTQDDLELVHSHIAKQAISPTQLDSAIPSILSKIIMKLMAKNAEDRYQSAWGLKADLEQCLSQLNAKGSIAEFPLGTQDISDKFLIPQKLYGRETEITQLLQAFERVSLGKSQLLLVAGYSGIGKSALVQEIYKPITEKRGYFIAGKFDQLQRNVPYSAIIQAFRDLVRQLLTEPQTQLDYWKNQIVTAVGNNGLVIIEVIAEVELIIGAQAAVPSLPPTESQNRFNLVFQNFIQVFCQAEHPLTIFLDDLQWIDSASLKLMGIMTRDIPHLLLIGAYRDNEVSPAHPLMSTVHDMQKQGLLIQNLTLSPLKLADLNQLISETLHLPLSQTCALAELVLEKTGGNSFFVGEFLKTLYLENLLTFNLEKRAWQWDVAQIKARNITANVVELMTAKIQRLAKNTQVLLKLAASVGNQFDLPTLALISETAQEQVKTALWEALQEGLILPLSGEHYKFVHDRVQQASYSLIPEAERPSLHWKIGQILRNDPNNFKERLFEIVDHLNVGAQLLNTVATKTELAQLNLTAGKQAKTSTAFDAALQYFLTGLELLAADAWETEYGLCLELHSLAAETATLEGDFEKLESLFFAVTQHAKTKLDMASVYESRIHSYVFRGKIQDSLNCALEIFGHLGLDLPIHPTYEDFQQVSQQLKAIYATRAISSLIDLPEMRDPKTHAIIELIGKMIASAYIGRPILCLVISVEQVRLCILQGNTSGSAYVYALYAFTLCGAEGDIEGGYQFAQLAIAVLEKSGDIKFKSKTLNALNGHVLHFKRALSLSLADTKMGYLSGLETGDFEYAGYNALFYSCNAYFSGRELQNLAHEMAAYHEGMRRIRAETGIQTQAPFWQAVLNLLGQSSQPTRLDGKAFVLDEMLPLLEQTNNQTTLAHYYLNTAMLCYLFEEDERAFEAIQLTIKYQEGVFAMFAMTMIFFYDSLIRLRLHTHFSPEAQAVSLQQIATNQDKMRRWAFYAPMNFQHKYDLVEAEQARVLGNFEIAAKTYEKAIAGARENEYIQEEALAYELASRFYLAHGMDKIAQTYVQEAHYAYTLWGAVTKLKALEQKYPQLLNLNTPKIRKATTTTTHLSTTGHGFALDLLSVIKANQAIFGEIILEKLLTALMKIIIQNAGAQTGYLILAHQDKLVIEASGTLENIEGSLKLQSINLETCPSLSQMIVNYVARTKKSVVLDNATQQGNFINDPYVKQQQPKSILCVPLINQGQLVSVVYLENNLTTGAFTAERIEILNLLASQAAISIQNAYLYAEVRKNERTLTQFLEAIPVGIGIIDASGTPYFVNQKGQDLLGQGVIKETRNEQITTAYELYIAGTEQIYPPEKLPVLRALQGKYVRVDDLEVHQQDRIIPLEAWGSPIFDDKGNILYAMTVFQDITYRKQAEANKIRLIQEQEAKNAALRYSHEIEEKNVELVRLNQEKNEFLGIAAHDLKNPLSGILGLADIMIAEQGALSSTEILEYATMMEDSARRMFTLITNLLDVNAIESGKINTHLEKLDILPVVNKLVQTYVERATVKNINIDFQVSEPHYIAFVDYNITQQVLDNLISNAIKYSPHYKNVTVKIYANDGYVHCEIQDEGPGLSEADQKKLFGKFTRLSTKPTGDEHSTGLGLFIVKKLVTALNGRVWCESELGNGAKFTVAFPIK